MGRLGEQQHAHEREHEDGALDEQGGAVHPHRAHGHHVPGGPGRERRAGADGDGQPEGTGETAEGQSQVRGPPRGPWDERLHQDARHGHAEDQQHGRKLPVFDVRRRDGLRRRSEAGEARHGVVPFWRWLTVTGAPGRPGTRPGSAATGGSRPLTPGGVAAWRESTAGAGCGGTGSVAWTCTSVWLTAGLMMFSSGCGKKPKKMSRAISGPTASSSLGRRSWNFSTSGRTGPVIVRW